MADPLLEIADELYALPLGDFTVRRDALVREHRSDKELAARVRRLRKPTMAAWVVNLFVRRDPDQVAQVLEVGSALREAQENLDAEELRALTRQRRQLTAAVTTQARRVAREEGHKVTEPVAEQVEATLTAAMVDQGAAAAVRSGLLVTAMAATGVEAVDAGAAVAVPEAIGFAASPREAGPPSEPSPRPELHLVPDPDAEAKAVAAAEEALGEAREAHEQAAEAASEADADVERLEARALQLQAELDELRRRLAQVESQQEDNDDELSDAEEVRAEARDALRDAVRDLEAAQAARDSLDR